ncbi:MAG: hypothetical protein Kow0075_12190 [Salibacteraceae bacterium]
MTKPELTSINPSKILSIAGIGLWEYHSGANRFYLDETAHSLLELDYASPVTPEHFLQMMADSDRASFQTAWKSFVSSGANRFSHAFKRIGADGSIRYLIMEGAKSEEKFPDGTNSVIGNIRDITNKHLLQKQLIEREHQLEKFVKHTPAAVAMLDKDLRYIVTSDRWHTDYGLKSGSIIGKSHFEIFPDPAEHKKWNKIFEKCLQGKSMKKEEDFLLKADGTKEWIRLEIHPWYQDENTVGGIIMFTEVITARKNAENRLRISEERFKGAFEHSAIGMAIVSTEGKWLKVNKKVCEYLGYTEVELLSTTFQDITHPDDLDLDLNYVHQMLRGEIDTYQMEKRYFRKDGSIIWVLLSVSLVWDENDEPLHFVSQIEDITERVLQKAELEAANERMRGVLQSSTSGIIELKAVRDGDEIIDFEWTLVNRGYELLSHRSETELIGHRLLQVMPEYADNGLFDIYKKTVISGIGADLIHLEESSEDGKKWYHIRAVKVGDGVAVTIDDITEETLARQHREALIGQLSRRNQQLKEFTHILSHNIRSPLASISMLMSVMETTEDEQEYREMWNKLDSVTKNLYKLLDELVEMLKILDNNEIVYENVSIREVIENVLKREKAAIEYVHAKIEVNLREWDTLRCPKIYLDSIFHNLLSNSLKYTVDGRTPHIKIETKKSGNKRVLTFSDNGRGIDLTRHKNSIFRMQKTFHRDKSGSGLGLFMTKTQVEAIGGSISVDSEVNKGTVFTLTFE